MVPIVLHGYRPPPPASNPVAAQFSALDDLFAHYPVLTLIHIASGLAVHAAGAVAVQFDYSCPSSALAPLERPSFCGLWICDWNFGVDHEFWDAGDRRRQSSRRDHFVRVIFFAGAVQGILADPAARSCAAPRVDDSRILNWACGGYYPADYGDIFRHEPLFRV